MHPGKPFVMQNNAPAAAFGSHGEAERENQDTRGDQRGMETDDVL